MDRRPDVVLSYARNTASLARATHKFLRSAGLDVWFDELSVRSGDHWLAGHYRALTWARHHLILLTEKTALDWARATFDYAERCAALNRSLETIPLLREGFDPGPIAERLTRYEVAHLAHDKALLDTQLRALVGRLREHPMRAASPSPNGFVDPYPGLRPHRPTEARFFFGRDREASEAVARLGTQSDGKHRRWLRIVGPPGVGKTAFAGAGVGPAVLRAGVQGAPLAWRVATVRLGDQPLTALAEGLARALRGAEASQVRGDLRRSGLADLIKEQLPADHGLLLVIDHLEDVDGRAVEPAAVARLDTLLAEALEDFDQRMFLVTAERVDLAEAVEHRLPRTAALLSTHGALYSLSGLTRDGLKAVVEGPAALVGRPWPPPLARRLLDDAERQPGGPASLSWMLSALMHAERPSIQAYEELGTLTHGVARACDARIEALSEDDRGRARGLLCSLVEVGRGQGDRPTSVGYAEAVVAAGDGPRAEAVVERLEASRPGADTPLLRIEGPEGQRRVRLAHWALIRLWPGLRGWIEADRPVLERREAVERAAARWIEDGRNELDLPRGARLSHLAGDDLDDTRRRRLRAVLPGEARRFIEAAELADLARKEREEAQRDADHEAAIQKIAVERDGARSDVASLRRLVGLLGLLGLLLGAWVFYDELRIGDLESQVRAGQERFQNKSNQLDRAEREKFDAQEARGRAEAARREAELKLSRAETLRAQAERNAAGLLAFALDTWQRSDELMARVPGNDGKYVRRLMTSGQLDALEKQIAEQPDNPRMRLLLARQRQLLAEMATGRRGLDDRARHLRAAVEALEPLAGLDRPPAEWLEALAAAKLALAEFATRATPEGQPDEYADFEAGRKAFDDAIALYVRLATEDADDAARHREQAARSKAALGAFFGQTGRLDEARTLIGEAIAETRALAEAAPQDGRLKVALAARLADLGEAETAGKAYVAARKAFEEAAQALEGVAAGEGVDPDPVQSRVRRGLRALPPAP